MNKEDLVEIEDTHSRGYIIKRRVNGVEVKIYPIPSDLVVIDRMFMTPEEYKNKLGKDIKYEFQECDTCAAKPGTPPLCSGCLHNRTAIEMLNKA